MVAKKYNYRNIDMLTAAKIVLQNLSDNLSDLSMVRTNWTPDYVATSTSRAENAIENYLGRDKTGQLRGATKNLTSIQMHAMRDLSLFKTQIEVDFGREAKEILKKLGFNSNLRSVQREDQEALIQQLYTFKTGMTDKLKTQITENGTNPALIERIIDYAAKFQEANILQETLKERTKALSEEGSVEFNEIYKEAIGICKIASAFYRYEPLKKNLFTFKKIVANLNAPKKVTGELTEH